MTTSLITLATLQGCGDKAEMQPTATPNVPAPGHGPSDGGSGNTPTQSEAGSDTTPAGSSGAKPSP